MNQSVGDLPITELREYNENISDNKRKSSDNNAYIIKSPKMIELFDIACKAAFSQANVLITGESGTGKDIMARIIHTHSKRNNNKFVKVTLTELAENLIEAELFGVMKGAYTGAYYSRIGKFEQANGGTLFLDEIGELSPHVQTKLLNVIQDRQIVKLGSNESCPIDVRFITATNKNLLQLVEESKFREDLYYRINVINLHVPPLRERKEEIPSLIDFFLNKFNNRENKHIAGISKEALNSLLLYDYPGNIRELENIIERAIVLCSNGNILPNHLLFPLEQNTLGSTSTRKSTSLPKTICEFEKRLIISGLCRNGNNKSKTALELGISEARLRYKMKSLDIYSSFATIQ